MLFHSEVLTGASGSIGGVTYSHNRSGMYRRARSIPVNPNTSFQTQVRSALTDLVNRWIDTLNSAQRSAWNTYGQNVPVTNPLGASITLSGQNWYIAANAPRLQVNSKIGPPTALPRLDNAPTIYDRGDFTTPTFAAPGGGDIDVGFTNTDDWASEPDSALLIFMGRPQNPTINFFNGPWRLVAIVEGNAVPPTSPLTIGPSTRDSLGYPAVEGASLWLSFAVTRADGRLSTRRQVGPVTDQA